MKNRVFVVGMTSSRGLAPSQFSIRPESREQVLSYSFRWVVSGCFDRVWLKSGDAMLSDESSS